MPGQVPQTTATGVVSAARLNECLASASFWAQELPRYANRRQLWADTWAIVSGTLATVTGLAVWPVMTDGSSTADKVLITAGALLSGFAALMPRIKNYGELAGQAREMASTYGTLVGEFGDLVDLAAANSGHVPAATAQSAIAAFDTVKAQKDGLRYLQDKNRVLRRRSEAHTRLLTAQAKEMRALDELLCGKDQSLPAK